MKVCGTMELWDKRAASSIRLNMALLLYFLGGSGS